MGREISHEPKKLIDIQSRDLLKQLVALPGIDVEVVHCDYSRRGYDSRHECDSRVQILRQHYRNDNLLSQAPQAGKTLGGQVSPYGPLSSSLTVLTVFEA